MTTWTEYGIQEILEISLKGASQPTSCDFHLIGGNATNLTKDAGNSLYSGSALAGQQLSGSDATRSFSRRRLPLRTTGGGSSTAWTSSAPGRSRRAAAG